MLSVRPMKLVMIVFRSSMEEDVFGLLARLHVSSFTDIPEVFGAGETGRVFASFEQPGSNSVILAALEDDDVPAVIEGLRHFRHGANIPVRAFVLPCVQAL